MSDEFLVHFDDLEVGQVVNLGACAVDADAVADFSRRFAPGWEASQGAPDALVYAYWSKLETESAKRWARSKSLAVDALRFSRTPPAGELLRARMTVMGKDPVGDERGVIIAQQDLLDEAGRLIFSCLTRAVFLRR